MSNNDYNNTNLLLYRFQTIRHMIGVVANTIFLHKNGCYCIIFYIGMRQFCA